VLIKDLGSKNGSFLNGRRLRDAREATDGSILQAGGCLFVICADLSALASPGERATGAMAGKFHTVPLVHHLRIAAKTGRHLLLEGESGSGKELASQVIHAVLGDLGRSGPLVAVNAAHFAGEDDAISRLFGVRG
jgi:transcriptional regulator of acetoin/glycerol metabolism